MADPSDDLKRQYTFFHALSKLLTEESQFPFNSAYKSGHVNFTSDILADEIPYLPDSTSADAYVSGNPDKLAKYTQYSLTEVAGSNGQTWYIDDGGEWIRPIMLPTLAIDPTTNEPSNGLVPFLYESDNTLIPPTDGVWFIDSFQGVVKFEEGFTPTDMGWGNPKITCYAYVGSTLNEVISGGVGGGFTPLAGEGMIITPTGSDYTFAVDDYISLTEVSNVSGGLQLQIDNINTSLDNKVDITGDVMTGDLEMSSSSVKITGGQIELDGSILAKTTASGVVTNTIIDTIDVSLGNCAFWDVCVSDGSNFRASRLMVVWNGTDIRINESSTESLGDTSGVVMNVMYNGGNTEVQLKASITSGTWTVQAFKKVL